MTSCCEWQNREPTDLDRRRDELKTVRLFACPSVTPTGRFAASAAAADGDLNLAPANQQDEQMNL